jgi:hypothetical protein
MDLRNKVSRPVLELARAVSDWGKHEPRTRTRVWPFVHVQGISSDGSASSAGDGLGKAPTHAHAGVGVP